MTTPWPKTSSAASSASESICAISPQGHKPWQTSSLISRLFTIRCARIPLLAGVLRMPLRVPCLSIPPPECDTTRYPAFLSVFSSFLLSTKPGRAQGLPHDTRWVSILQGAEPHLRSAPCLSSSLRQGLLPDNLRQMRVIVSWGAPLHQDRLQPAEFIRIWTKS